MPPSSYPPPPHAAPPQHAAAAARSVLAASVPDSTAGVVEAVMGASRVLVAVAARSLADSAEEVTLPQYRALVVIAGKGPQGVAALADALGVTPPTATRMCDRLVRKGLVRRRSSVRDRRQVRIALTPEGNRLVTEVAERRRAEIAGILRKLSPGEQAAIVESFAKLAGAAGEVPDSDWVVDWDL